MTLLEEELHKKRIAFMIVDGNILYLKYSKMSHREWAEQLGISKSKFDSLVRGFIRDGGIYYYQGDFETNDKVIEVALDTCDIIAKENGLVDYEVYCGFVIGKIGEEWKPILKIK